MGFISELKARLSRANHFTTNFAANPTLGRCPTAEQSAVLQMLDEVRSVKIMLQDLLNHFGLPTNARPSQSGAGRMRQAAKGQRPNHARGHQRPQPAPAVQQRHAPQQAAQAAPRQAAQAGSRSRGDQRTAAETAGAGAARMQPQPAGQPPQQGTGRGGDGPTAKTAGTASAAGGQSRHPNPPPPEAQERQQSGATGRAGRQGGKGTGAKVAGSGKPTKPRPAALGRQEPGATLLHPKDQGKPAPKAAPVPRAAGSQQQQQPAPKAAGHGASTADSDPYQRNPSYAHTWIINAQRKAERLEAQGDHKGAAEQRDLQRHWQAKQAEIQALKAAQKAEHKRARAAKTLRSRTHAAPTAVQPAGGQEDAGDGRWEMEDGQQQRGGGGGRAGTAGRGGAGGTGREDDEQGVASPQPSSTPSSASSSQPRRSFADALKGPSPPARAATSREGSVARTLTLRSREINTQMPAPGPNKGAGGRC